MSSFGEELNLAAQTALSNKAEQIVRKEEQQLLEAERNERYRVAREEEKKRNNIKWEPLLEAMGSLALEAANYLQTHGAPPEAEVRRIIRERKQNLLLGAKTFTKLIPAWIITQHSAIEFSDSDTRTSRGVWTVTTGSALGVDGNLYDIADRNTGHPGKFIAETSLREDSRLEPETKIDKQFECFGPNPFPHNYQPDPEQVLYAWKGTLRSFVVKTMTSS